MVSKNNKNQTINIQTTKHINSQVAFNGINCYTCGGPLSKTIGLCKCDYCGNTNAIDATGKTYVVPESPLPKNQKNPHKLSNLSNVLIVGAAILFPLYFFKKRISSLSSI